MTIKKIEDKPFIIKGKEPCKSPEHEPPTHVSLQPGTYEHKCPLCGDVRVFRVVG